MFDDFENPISYAPYIDAQVWNFQGSDDINNVSIPVINDATMFRQALVDHFMIDINSPHANVREPILAAKTKVLLVYPNPTTGIVNFLFSGENMVYRISVSNSLGQCIYSADLGIINGIYNGIINLNHSGQGLYFVSLLSDSGQLIQKIIIE
jgi:hypothetical protein